MYVDAERTSERPELADADLALAALDEADDGPVKPSFVGELLLAESPANPELPDPHAEIEQIWVGFSPPTRSHVATV